jgi:type I restriction enzyme S subunit
MVSKYRLVNFGDMCEHSAFGPRFSSNEYAPDGNVACLRTMDMDFSGRINFDAMPLAKLDLSRLRNHILRRDDLVITRTGAYLGKAAVFTQFRLPVVAGAFSICFRLNREIAWPVFVRYFFNSSVGQTATRSIATGSAQPNLNIPLLFSLSVPLPPLHTQRKIASVLSAYDDLIENNTRRIAILESMAQALYQEWFVRFRFPGHENVPLVPSPLGDIPQGWKPTTWGELARLEYGKALRTYREGGGEFPVFGTNGAIGWHDKALCKSDGVIIGRKGAYRGVHYSKMPFWVIDTAFYLCPQWSGLDIKWCFFTLKEVDINSIDSGSAIPSTSRDAFYAIPVVLPPTAITVQFREMIDPIISACLNLRSKINNLRKTRDLLLPKLISGQIDVEHLDIDTGASLKEVVS